MQISVIESPGKISIENVPVPEISAEEILVKLQGNGVCVSNLPVWEGREWFQYPYEPGSPGHEGYGVVAGMGEQVTGFSLGDKVALISHHAYAEYDKAHLSNVVKIPALMNGTPFLGEPLACAVNILKRSDIRPGQTVLVIGAGFIGCLLIQLLKHAGAHVIAVSRRTTSLEFAKKAGADHVISFTDQWTTAREVYRLAPGGLSRIVEATGSQMAIDLATEVIGERGKMIIAGYHQDGLRNVNLQAWNWKGIDVINAHERDPKVYIEGLKEAIEKVEQNILRPSEFITHYFNLSEINAAFQTLKQRPEGFLKAVITYS